MTRRKLNLKLLGILGASALVIAVAVHFLHRHMQERNAGALLTLAEQAEQKQELRKAAGYLRTYVNFRPEDTAGYVRWANLAADLASSPGATLGDVLLAKSVLENATLKAPEDQQVRRRLVEISLRMGRLREAREHLQTLVAAEPANLPNQVLLAQTLSAEGDTRGAEKLLYKLIGYDYATGTFDPQQAIGARHTPAYVVLAETLYTLLESPEQADAVMNQLVAVNADNFRAWLERGAYRLRHGQAEEAAADIERAASMSPGDADVLLAGAEIEINQGDTAAARRMLSEALEKYPTQARFYRALANLELTQEEDPSQALRIVERGMKAAKDSRMLLSYKAELQLRAGRLAELDATIEAMTQANLDAEVVSFYRARKLLAEQQWVAGARELERLRPLVARSPERQMEVNLYLGLCYERLGQPDRALEAYQLALRADARQELARQGLARVQPLVGRATTNNVQAPADHSLAQRVAALLKLPEADRDWSEVEELLTQQIREKKLDDAAAALVWAQMMGLRGEFAAGGNMLAPLLEQHPQNTALWILAIDLARQDPRQGVAAALQLAGRAEQALGDSVDIRLARAMLLLQRDGQSADLSPLEANLEPLSRSDRRRLWAGLAAFHLNAQRWEETRRLWLRLAADDPNDLAMRLQLVELALQENNLLAMQAAQQLVFDVVKTQVDVAWQYAEAARLAILATQEPQSATLKKALEHIDQVLKDRARWNLAHALRARIVLQQGRHDEAIAAFQRALDLGPPRSSDLRQLISLLTYRGRFAEAQKALDLAAGQEARLGLRPELQAEIRLRAGDGQQGLQLAAQAVQEDPHNAVKLLWYGQVLARAGKFEESVQALQRAIDAAPRMPQPYLALLNLYAQLGRPADAEKLLAAVEQQLDAEQRPLVLARGAELLGQSDRAEKYYQQALAAAPAATVRLRALATFYLTGGYRGNDGAQKAAPLVTKVLQSTGESVTAAEDIGWARRAMATIRATGGTYPDLVAALALIEQNAVDGQLGREDQLQAALILAQRPEAVSRRKAVRYLQELQERGDLPPREQLALADLYHRMDNWQQCQTTMLELVARHPKDPLALTTFARLLLEHQATDQAQRYIARLAEIEPDAPSTLALRAELLVKQRKPEDAVKLLTADLPEQASPQDMTKFARAFLTLRELKLYPAAESVMRRLAALDAKNEPALAEFLGYYGDLDEAFAKLQSLAKSVPAAQLAQVSVNILHTRQKEAAERHFAQVATWLKQAEQDPAAALANLQTAAKLADLQARYADEEQAYRQLLARPETQGNLRAMVLNNLAFNLAMRNQDSIEARQLVDEAIQIHGPTGALLDTRAMVGLLSGEHARAISDLNLAISDQAKPERLFHLALAQLAAGNKLAALRALREAESRGLDAGDISPLERPHYDRLVRELGTAQAQAKN